MLASPAKNSAGRSEVAAFALNRLDDDAGDFFGVDDALEESAARCSRAFPRQRVRGIVAVRAAIGVRIVRVEDAGEQRAEILALMVLLRSAKARPSCGHESSRRTRSFCHAWWDTRQLDGALEASAPEFVKNAFLGSLPDKVPTSARRVAACFGSKIVCRTCESSSAACF